MISVSEPGQGGVRESMGDTREQADVEHLDAAVPGVCVVVRDGRPGPGMPEAPERISELTTREALAELIARLPGHGALSVERLDDPSAFAMACPIEGGRFRVWYEGDRGHSGGDTIRASADDAAEALRDWALRAKGWQFGFHPAHATPVPDRLPIRHEPEFRTDLIGSWDEGLFFAGYCGMTYLHLFDHDGTHVGSHVGVAEEDLGIDDAPACDARLREIVDALPGRRFGDIAVRLFRVEHAGREWGLFDLTAGYGFPHVEMEPDSLGFNPPWDGLYGT